MLARRGLVARVRGFAQREAQRERGVEKTGLCGAVTTRVLDAG
jgi:hypothetical protein